jgi:hypothetical protein
MPPAGGIFLPENQHPGACIFVICALYRAFAQKILANHHKPQKIPTLKTRFISHDAK